MQKTAWPQALKTCADPKRAEHYGRLLAGALGAAGKKIPPEQAQILAALFSGSPWAAELLVAHPEWLAAALDPELLKHPRQEQGLRREVNEWLKPALKSRDFDDALARLRRFRQREMMRIAARDLARLGDMVEITREISDVADVCLNAVLEICRQQLTDRLGRPYHSDPGGRWQPTAFCVLGMGKLGGQELNYSSDVDVIFVYNEEGFVFKEPPHKSETGGKGMSNHQFFKRLSEAFIAEVSRMTPEGALYRIDLRLRPEGAAGPLARSVSSYEHYYAQWGQTWERLMLLKARGVAGDAVLAAEFLEMVQPFRYPRSLNERTISEIAAMKQRIDEEVARAGEMDRNVKLGRGGIREIEFVTQTLQLLNAGRTPFLQDAQTLPALQKLVRYKLLAPEDAESLIAAYHFLRDAEHRLQMENNLQTHTIPTERKARERLAALMNCGSLAEFEKARAAHTKNVRAIYEKFIQLPAPSAGSLVSEDFEHAEAGWKQRLADHSFRDTDKAFRLFKEFVNGPGFVHVSPRTSDLARQLIPKFLALCPRQNEPSAGPVLPKPMLSDPDRVLARLDSFIAAYGTRAMLYELWTSNPSLFELLLWLFDRSEFLAEVAIRTPGLVDELELSGRLRREKSSAEILTDLRHGARDDDQMLWIRQYHQAELMRIGLRDILGLADFEQNLGELSALADACLEYAVEVVMRRHKLRQPPFAIIGLGKLGGSEINYGSDLDLLFVADSKVKNLSSLQRHAVEVMELLSSQTEMGTAFPTDARLRPDGEKGLLVNTLAAYEDYYRQRAQLWEIQTLSRARAIAGNVEVGAMLQELAGRLADFHTPSLPLAALKPDWKREIARMRLRIEKERTPPGQDHLAIKTGGGGLMDAEFIAQALCLEQGWHEANTLHALERIREAKLFPAGEAEQLLDNYRHLRRLEGILRRWSFEGETLLPDDPAPMHRVAVRCGFRDAEAFLKTLAEWRAAIRGVYLKVLG